MRILPISGESSEGRRNCAGHTACSAIEDKDLAEAAVGTGHRKQDEHVPTEAQVSHSSFGMLMVTTSLSASSSRHANENALRRPYSRRALGARWALRVAVSRTVYLVEMDDNAAPGR